MNYPQYLERQAFVRGKTSFVPSIGVVLGTGLGQFASKLSSSFTLPYSSIPHRPKATNAGHKGRLVFGYYQGIPVLLSQGRLHYYEGYTAEEAVRPVRLRKRLGVKRIILTNACGIANPKFTPGSFMLIKDQISLRVPSPLIGGNIPEFGPRFPDRSDVYDREERKEILKEAQNHSLPVCEGTYRQFSGPQFETAAEVSLAARLGADAVGRSTAIEAIACAHRGIKTIGISLLTNYGTGLSKEKLTDEEVKERGAKNSSRFEQLLSLSLHVLDKGRKHDR